jgi:hypothetical protein
MSSLFRLQLVAKNLPLCDPKQMETYSSPDQIAEVVYEAAIDGKDLLRYVAGADAKAAPPPVLAVEIC